jgi:pantetheine-phosphate adenylyltransferase
MKRAIFPGSFDPFTIGHLDVLQQALNLFDKVVIAIGHNSSKSGFFPIETRIRIINDAIKGMEDRVEVCAFKGLTVNFCKAMDARFIVRGMRTTTDFELESVIAQANKKLDPNIQTLFIPASHKYSFISSTVVRDVLVNGGEAHLFVPESVDIAKYIAERNAEI